MNIFAQQSNLFFNSIHYNALEADWENNSGVHFGFKPLLRSRLILDDVPGYAPDSAEYYFDYQKHLFSNNLIVVEGNDYRFSADPLLNLRAGWSLDGRARPNAAWDYRYNTRGFVIQGDVTDKFSFVTRFYETQSFVPTYMDSLVNESGSMPGMGRVKFNDDGEFDYSRASGYISYSPADWINLQFGHSSHFLGHGYRSMILSDFSFPYVFGKISLYSRNGKWAYHSLWGGLHDLARLPSGDAPESLFRRKSMSTYYVSYKPMEQLEIGLVEQTMWPRFKEGEGTRPFDAGFLSPVPLVNSARFGLDGENNVMWGVNAAFRPLDKIKVYGQFVVDEIEEPRAWQLGAQYFGPWNWLTTRIEYNLADDYMYSGEEISSAYTHNGLPLTHPQGAGFEEMLAKIQVQTGRWIGSISLSKTAFFKASGDSIVRAKRDPTVQSLANEEEGLLYLPDHGKQVRNYAGIEAGYVINTVTNLQIVAGATYRDYLAGGGSQQDRFYWVALRTNLRNRYPEF